MATTLTPKQEMFCKEYIIDFNATRAAIEAGYSEKTASVIATQNLGKLYIQEYIAQLMKKREERTEITADMVVVELAKIAFHDIRKLYDEHGNMIAVQDLDDESAATIASFKSRKEKTGKDASDYDIIDEYKRIDKLKSLELLGRHLAMFTDVKKHEGEITVNKGLNDFYEEAEIE